MKPSQVDQMVMKLIKWMTDRCRAHKQQGQKQLTHIQASLYCPWDAAKSSTTHDTGEQHTVSVHACSICIFINYL